MYAERISTAELPNLRSYVSDACCFQGNPLLLPNHHSVSLETKKWHLESYSASVVKTNTSATGKVQLR